MMKRLAAIGALVLMAFTASGVAMPYLSYIVDIEARYGLPLLFVSLLGVMWLGAYLYEHRGRMYEEECRGETKYNPYLVDHFNPFAERCYTNVHLINMKANYEILLALDKPEQAADLKTAIDKVENWFKLGYIPKQDFPKNTRKLVKTPQRRL